MNKKSGKPKRSRKKSNLGKTSEPGVTAFSEDAQFSFRKCYICGNLEMKPKATFTGTGMAASTQGGLIYRCPQCGVEAKISDSGALFMGLVYSLFWGSAGLWAFVSGPLWYARHASYFSTDDLTFLLFDMVVIVFCIGVMALSGWIVWSFLFGPAITILLHPVTGENRVKTDRETAQSKLDRRTALLSLFVYPLLLWIPLLGMFWAIDAIGINLHENRFIAYAGVGVVLALAAPVAKYLHASIPFTFVGLVIWMALAVTAIFALG